MRQYLAIIGFACAMAAIPFIPWVPPFWIVLLDNIGLAALVAASAGRPVAVTVEWPDDGAVPLSGRGRDRVLDLGSGADPAVVSPA